MRAVRIATVSATVGVAVLGISGVALADTPGDPGGGAGQYQGGGGSGQYQSGGGSDQYQSGDGRYQGGGSGGDKGGNPIIIVPSNPAPGAQISVFDGGNCPNGAGTATFSGPSILGSVPLSALSNQTGGAMPIPSSAKPGTYTVTITCKNGGTFVGSMIISAGGKQGWKPYGGAATGDGASLGSGGASEKAIGSAMAAGAVFLGVTAYRRRRAAAKS